MPNVRCGRVPAAPVAEPAALQATCDLSPLTIPREQQASQPPRGGAGGSLVVVGTSGIGGGCHLLDTNCLSAQATLSEPESPGPRRAMAGRGR